MRTDHTQQAEPAAPLPPLPECPYKTRGWSRSELQAMGDYGIACFEAGKHVAKPAPAEPLSPFDVCTVVGVKDGIETVLGTMPISPKSKARDILRSYGLEDFSPEGQDNWTDADAALQAVEDLVVWMKKVGWTPPEMTPTTTPHRPGGPLTPEREA